MSDTVFMQEAIRLAKENVARGGGPFGCVVVKNGEIIARGQNEVTLRNDPSAHAEVQAIRAACEKLEDYQLTDCILYSSCEPCPMCLGAIYWARPAAVYFAASRQDAAKAGFDDAFIYNEISLELHGRSIGTHMLEMDDKLSPFEEWAKNNVRRLY